jgi:FkbM family methyltransferase
MLRHLKKIAKQLHSISPISFSRNETYDRLTKKIIQGLSTYNGTCIDIGAHEGKILDWMLTYLPNATHYAFEPIPVLYERLKLQFADKAIISPAAIGNENTTSNFNLVLTNMAYSGLNKRAYDKAETDTTIQVQTAKLDSIIPISEKISLIKIDVEGAEFLVLKGAKNTINNNKPLILFECGKAGGDAYHFTANEVFDLLSNDYRYTIYTLTNWLQKKESTNKKQFNTYFDTGKEFFFLAAPNHL